MPISAMQQSHKELETNIFSSIREGRPLTGRDGALTPFIKNC